MGNEFGHPEWIDFPREGNDWSYQYARRQWHLVDSQNLKYQFLAAFDRDMISWAKNAHLLDHSEIQLIYEHNSDKILVFERTGFVFAFNFHPAQSQADYCFEVTPGKYTMIFNTDAREYGGHDRIAPGQVHFTMNKTPSGRKKHMISLYLPSRTAMVLERAQG